MGGRAARGSQGQAHWPEHLPPAPARLQEAAAARAQSRHGAQAQLGLEAMPACRQETEAPSQAGEGGTWPLLTLGQGQRSRNEASIGGPRWSHSVPSCTEDCPISRRHRSWGGQAPLGPGLGGHCPLPTTSRALYPASSDSHSVAPQRPCHHRNPHVASPVAGMLTPKWLHCLILSQPRGPAL